MKMILKFRTIIVFLSLVIFSLMTFAEEKFPSGRIPAASIGEPSGQSTDLACDPNGSCGEETTNMTQAGTFFPGSQSPQQTASCQSCGHLNKRLTDSTTVRRDSQSKPNQSSGGSPVNTGN